MSLCCRNPAWLADLGSCVFLSIDSDVNAGFGKWVEGLEPEESDELLKELYAQAEMPEYQCYFKYEAGSLAFW